MIRKELTLTTEVTVSALFTKPEIRSQVTSRERVLTSDELKLTRYRKFYWFFFLKLWNFFTFRNSEFFSPLEIYIFASCIITKITQIMKKS